MLVTTVIVPHGVVDAAGKVHREVELSTLTGHHELLLAETASAAGPVAESRLCALVIGRIGDFEDVDLGLVRLLARGDRHRLLLTVLQGLVGDQLALVARCDNPTCRALSDLDLSISELLGAPREAVGVEVDTPAGRIRVREPLGVDDELAAAGEPIWPRLVEDLAGEGPPSPERWLALDAGVRQQVALAFAEQSSALDLGIIGRCPECRARFDLWLDPIQLLRQATRAGVGRLFAEVHTLAWHYHWPEDHILALPRERRWHYLELVRRQLEGRPLDGAWS
ncbi:MAG: hypothetical protein V4850_08695 [Myxococcota bacterium]